VQRDATRRNAYVPILRCTSSVTECVFVWRDEEVGCKKIVVLAEVISGRTL